jgi:ketosteroid isomerase-like protein
MSEQQLLDLIEKYRKAFVAADEIGLGATVTNDVEWHMHYPGPQGISATGKVIIGVRAMVEEILRRQSLWRDVRFENLVERAAGDRILQMFDQSGIDEQGRLYNVSVVDVYLVRDGRISMKDTYWKGEWGEFRNP